MAPRLTPPWDPEEIPDDAQLYKFVHRNHIDDANRPTRAVFRNIGDNTTPNQEAGMSTDWDKYSTPHRTRNRVQSAHPEDNGVISLPVASVRLIHFQVVAHTPQPNNRAHTDVFGPKSPKGVTDRDERIRREKIFSDYLDCYQWEIMPDEPVMIDYDE